MGGSRAKIERQKQHMGGWQLREARRGDRVRSNQPNSLRAEYSYRVADPPAHRISSDSSAGILVRGSQVWVRPTISSVPAQADRRAAGRNVCLQTS